MDISHGLLLSRKQSGGGGGDPYEADVVLFLKGDGANGSTNIIDSSPNPKTIDRFGDTKISTAQSKYGGSSILFDGSGDYLSGLSNSNFQLENETNWTIEFFVYFVTNPTIRQTLLANRTGTQGYVIGSNASTGKLGFSAIGQGAIYSDNALDLNSWQHCAIVRNSSTISLFVNGIKSTSTYSGILNISTLEHRIGGYDQIGNPFYFNGYLDSLRITKGIARYTANFNPETDTYLNV
jgi:hypothetical protein